MRVPITERVRIHGLYSKVISTPEKRELEKIRNADIKEEIAYLRIICSRLAAIANANGVQHGAVEALPDSTIRTLNTLDRKLNTLLRFIRAQAYLSGGPNEYDRQIDEGEFIARKNRNVFNYLSAGKTAKPGGRPGTIRDVDAE